MPSCGVTCVVRCGESVRTQTMQRCVCQQAWRCSGVRGRTARLSVCSRCCEAQVTACVVMQSTTRSSTPRVTIRGGATARCVASLVINARRHEIVCGSDGDMQRYVSHVRRRTCIDVVARRARRGVEGAGTGGGEVAATWDAACSCEGLLPTCSLLPIANGCKRARHITARTAELVSGGVRAK